MREVATLETEGATGVYLVFREVFLGTEQFPVLAFDDFEHSSVQVVTVRSLFGEEVFLVELELFIHELLLDLEVIQEVRLIDEGVIEIGGEASR